MDVPTINMVAAVGSGVVFGALLTAVDAGLAALGDARLRAVAEADGRSAQLAQRVLSQRTGIRTRLLVGRVLAVMFAAACAALAALQEYDVGVAMAVVAGVGLLSAVLASIASTIARRRSHRIALRLFRWVRPVELLLAPVAAPVVSIARLVERVLPAHSEDDEERIAELTVEHVIEQGEETGSITQDHAQMLRSVLEFKNTVAREIMVPRTQVVAFEIETPISEVMKAIVESGHSRYPVYREHVDQMEGLLHSKDLFETLGNGDSGKDVEIKALIRKPVFFAAETQKIGLLLKEMQRRRTHLAVVVDEFGGASGIVTLEDIVEEIVGEIQDEHDEELPSVIEQAPGRYIADASTSVYDVEEVLGDSLCDNKEDFDTLGGMIVHLAGRVPAAGEVLEAGAFQLRVLEADERHVSRVELVRHSRPAPDTTKVAV